MELREEGLDRERGRVSFWGEGLLLDVLGDECEWPDIQWKRKKEIDVTVRNGIDQGSCSGPYNRARYRQGNIQRNCRKVNKSKAIHSVATLSMFTSVTWTRILP
jgi:hypothetical protein